jgi:foldase protein PrsA
MREIFFKTSSAFAPFYACQSLLTFKEPCLMKMKSLLFLSLAVFSLTSCGHRGGSSDATSLDKQVKSGKPLASLGDVEVHEGYLELLARVNPNIEAQLKNPAGKKRLVDSLLEQELLYNESLKQGISKQPEALEKAALYQRVIFSQAILDAEVDKKAKEYYDANKDKEFSQVDIAQILIRNTPPLPSMMKKDEKGNIIPPNIQAMKEEALKKAQEKPTEAETQALEAAALKKAKEAKAKLDAGTPWQQVVDEYSDDNATKSRGGDLGMISKGDRRIARLDWNELVDKAFSMKEGQISDPIKAKDGYHIIKLLKEASIAPYEEVENSIKFRLRSQVKNELLANLTKGKTTDYQDDELKALSQTAAPGAPLIPGAEGGQGMQAAPAPAAPASTEKGAATKPDEKKPLTPKAPAPLIRGDGSQVIQTPTGPQVVKTKMATVPTPASDQKNPKPAGQ